MPEEDKGNAPVIVVMERDLWVIVYTFIVFLILFAAIFRCCVQLVSVPDEEKQKKRLATKVRNAEFSC